MPLEPPASPRSPGAGAVSGEPEPLTERAQREASFPIEVYGDGLVRYMVKQEHALNTETQICDLMTVNISQYVCIYVQYFCIQVYI